MRSSCSLKHGQSELLKKRFHALRLLQKTEETSMSVHMTRSATDRYITVVPSAMVGLPNLSNEELLAVTYARASIGPFVSASRCFLLSLLCCLCLIDWLILFVSRFTFHHFISFIDLILDRLLSKRNFQFVRAEFK